MAEHIVSAFDQDLNGLKGKIAEMGGIAEKMIADAMDALATRDNDLAVAVQTMDTRLDVLQRDVEEAAILTIARRQPMAVDLREVVSAIRISSDLERVGDLAKNVARRIVAMEGEYMTPKAVNGLIQLSRLALGQLKSVLDGYMQRSDALALRVWHRDSDIDALYTALFRQLLTQMMEDPRNITFSTHLIFSAKNMERIGDHATNIAETVHFLITGENFPGDRPKSNELEESRFEVEVHQL